MNEQEHGPDVSVISRTPQQQVNRGWSLITAGAGIFWSVLQEIWPHLPMLLAQYPQAPKFVAALGLIIRGLQSIKDAKQAATVNRSGPANTPTMAPGASVEAARGLGQAIPAEQVDEQDKINE